MIPKTTWKSAVSSFWKGATEPTLGTIAGILGLVIFQIVVLCWYWTPQRMAQIKQSWVPNSFSSQYAYTSVIANRLKYLPSTDNSVVMVSTSSGRNSIHNFDQTSQQLSLTTGLTTNFYMLSTAGQTIWESGIILDCLPTDFNGVVIFSVGLKRLTWGHDTLETHHKTPRIAVNSSFLLNETKLAGLAMQKPSGIFLLDYRNFFFEFGFQAARAAMQGYPKSLHLTSNRQRNNEEHWKTYLQRLNQQKKLFAENSSYNLGVLARIIGQLQEKDIPVVLMESTLHPRTYQIMGSDYLQYRHTIEEFATTQHLPYWNLNNEAELSAADFMDNVHISNPDARKRYQHILVQHLAELIKQEQTTIDLK
ncbi:MAG: hypothetical protein V3U75_05810 [Methylococcaceae bacterium]